MPSSAELKEMLRKALPDLDLIIAWGKGRDALHASPLFIRKEEDLEDLVLGPSCVHNLARYLPDLKGKKVGIVVKGCDSRTVIELLQEDLISREDLTIFGFHCDGVVSTAKLQHLLEGAQVDKIEMDSTTVHATCGDKVHDFPREQVAADKCLTCAYPDALISDEFAGSKAAAEGTDPEARCKTLEELEDMSLEERFQFWEKEMSRCLRCYACRNSCPLCVCRDHCAADSREPHWISQDDSPREKLMFQIMHVFHTAGRCTECGECERACPVGIPLLSLRQKMNREVKRIFDYEAGTDIEATPPLLCFKKEEENIKERSW